MPIVEGVAKAAEGAGKVAAAVGKDAAQAGAMAAKTAANTGANAVRTAGSGIANAGSGLSNAGRGLGSSTSGLGNKPSGLGVNKANGLGNNNHGLNRPNGLGNRNHGLGGNQGLNNKNKGLGSNKGLGNDLGKNEDGLHKKGLRNSGINKANPFSPRNYLQRVKQIQNKKVERGEDATGILPYIQAIPFIVKIYAVSLIVFIIFIVFGVSLFAAIHGKDIVDYSVVSGAMAGYTGQIASNVPTQISTLSSSTSNTISSHIAPHYQHVANNLGYNQTPTTTDGTPVSEDELLYYQKIADIAFRYKNLYNIDLDWVLITTANMYGHNSNDGFFQKNVGGYDSTKVADLDNTMSLDWDYDYEALDEYLYRNNYTYDLQILAKNMVTKTTTQQCVSGTTVLEKKEVIDVEDSLLNEENPDYLVCKTGTYKVKSEYKLDMEKFDEFLLEYLDSRMYGAKGVSSGDRGQHSPASPAPSTGRWGWPLPVGASSCRSSVYGTRVHPITGVVHFHSGDDYPAAGGTPVYAIGDGTVIDVKTNCTVGNRDCGGGAGNYVKIDHGGGVVSVYMHASSVSVSKGQHVYRGQEIMKVGTTGSSTGNHLHITIRLNGQLDDPKNYIGALPHC